MKKERTNEREQLNDYWKKERHACINKERTHERNNVRTIEITQEITKEINKSRKP